MKFRLGEIKRDHRDQKRSQEQSVKEEEEEQDTARTNGIFYDVIHEQIRVFFCKIKSFSFQRDIHWEKNPNKGGS